MTTYTWTDRCGAVIVGRHPEHCDGSTCHQTFASTRAGDAHRIGPHESWRRCLTVAEMEAKTNEKGEKMFYKNERGYWTLTPPAEAA